MKGQVNIKSSTRGEFDLWLTVWLINPENPEDEVDVIYEADTWLDVSSWCERNGYEIVEKPEWVE